MPICGPVAISMLAAIVLCVGVTVSVHFRNLVVESETRRARDEFASASANIGRGLGAALESSRGSFNGMHAAMTMFPSLTFGEFATLSSAFQSNFRQTRLEYIPFVRTEAERHEWEVTISDALESPRVFHKVRFSGWLSDFYNTVQRLHLCF